MTLRFQRLSPNASVPTAATPFAAGYDLRACLDAPVDIAPGQTVMVGTGLAIALPEGWFGAVFARSGLAARQGLRPANCVGVCDCDYRGEYLIPLHNDSDETRTVSHGDRIAQLVLLPCPRIEFEEAESLPASGRGVSGFGSTGLS
ncbi:MAG: dUTP diphosphatase [Oscillospiraceae bacterium]|nr:dUTP diphosphatase [Oscillospiraceae bacterium]